MLLRQIFDSDLAQYAYLIGCQRSGEALIVDPQRDVDRYLELAADESLRLVAAAETHIHADFLSGARELAVGHGVRAYLSAEGGEDWAYGWPADTDGADVRLLRDGDSFRVGGIELRAVHCPGHTPEHLGYLVIDRGGGADEPMGLASGDFVFVGDLGRPDLLESAAGETGAREPAARQLFASARRFLDLDDYLQVWPGHGAGSSCGKALGAVPETTVGYERRYNAALASIARGEDAFVAAILDGQPEPPLYFGRMKHLNRDGPPILGELPRPGRLDWTVLSELAGRADVAVVDTRADRHAFLAAHLPRSLWAPLGQMFPAVVGSYVEPATAIVLVIDEAEVDRAVRGLVRIGLDRVEGFLTPADLAASGAATARIESIDFTAVAELRAQPGVTVLDVRRQAEHDAGHVIGALNIAHTRLLERHDEVPRDRTVLVHCLSGARAAAAAALLARFGHDVRHVDDQFSVWNDLR